MVNVQNRVQAALPLLPEEVRRMGVIVSKSSMSPLLVIAMQLARPRLDDLFVSNYTLVNVVDELRRMPGVGQRADLRRQGLRHPHLAQAGSARGSWGLDALGRGRGRARAERAVRGRTRSATPPMKGRVDMASDGDDAGPPARSRSSSATSCCAPTPTASVVRLRRRRARRAGRAGLQLQRPAQAAQPVMRASASSSRPSANALEVSEGHLRDAWTSSSKAFPKGLAWSVPYDTTRLRPRPRSNEVIKTLFEAHGAGVPGGVGVPAELARHAHPVAGGAGVADRHVRGRSTAFGFSINTLTLFGMVLAIGIVVDDAIVVLENVERIMRERARLAREEARSRDERGRPGRSSPSCWCWPPCSCRWPSWAALMGEMYRQFAVTIAMSVMHLRLGGADAHARACAR